MNTCSYRIAKLTRFLLVMLCVCTLGACRSTKNTDNAFKAIKKRQIEQLTPLAVWPEKQTNLSSKFTVSLDLGQQNVSLKGRMYMHKDKEIMLSFSALGLMELGYVEFTPEIIRVVDRVNKRYVEMNYSVIPNDLGVNFTTVQALFWDKLFLFGKGDIRDRLSEFEISSSGSQCLLVPSVASRLQSRFYTDSKCTRLEQTELSFGYYEAIWRYDLFDTIEGYTFPTSYDISLAGGPLVVGMRLVLNNPTFAAASGKKIVDLSKYQQVDLFELVESLR